MNDVPSVPPEVSFELVYSNLRERHVIKFNEKVMTKQQFLAIKQVVESTEFDFSCLGPEFFQESKEVARGGNKPFHFTYYDKDGKISLKKFSRTGAVLKSMKN